MRGKLRPILLYTPRTPSPEDAQTSNRPSVRCATCCACCEWVVVVIVLGGLRGVVSGHHPLRRQARSHDLRLAFLLPRRRRTSSRRRRAVLVRGSAGSVMDRAEMPCSQLPQGTQACCIPLRHLRRKTASQVRKHAFARPEVSCRVTARGAVANTRCECIR